jgi:hypothetical protein
LHPFIFAPCGLRQPSDRDTRGDAYRV